MQLKTIGINKTAAIVTPFFIFMAAFVGIQARRSQSPLEITSAIDPIVGTGATISFRAGVDSSEGKVFHAPEMVYAMINFPNRIFGTHQIEAKWVQPDGVLYETTSVRLKFPPTGSNQAYIWIRFNSSSEGLFFNSEDLSPRPNMNGLWKLETTIDGEFINNASFEIQGY